MASLIVFNSTTQLTLSPSPSPSSVRAHPNLSHVPPIRTVQFPRRRSRGSTVLTNAGPSQTSYILAFAIPFSLLAVTIFTSIKISDQLDKQFMEEVALNQAIREGEEDYDSDAEISFDEIVKEPVVQRTRNRPKREAERP